MRYLLWLAIVLVPTVLVIAENVSYSYADDDMLQLTLEEHTELLERMLQNRHNWPDPLGINRYMNASHEVSFGVIELGEDMDILPLEGRLMNEVTRRLLVAHGFKKPKGHLRYTGRNLARDVMDLKRYQTTEAKSFLAAIAPFRNAGSFRDGTPRPPVDDFVQEANAMKSWFTGRWQRTKSKPRKDDCVTFGRGFLYRSVLITYFYSDICPT